MSIAHINGWQRTTFSGIRPVQPHDVGYDIFLGLQPLILLRGLSRASVWFKSYGFGPNMHQQAMERYFAASLTSKELVLSSHEMMPRLGTRDMRDDYLGLRLAEVEVAWQRAKEHARRMTETLRSYRDVDLPFQSAWKLIELVKWKKAAVLTRRT